jgi:hypothetical protein
MISAWWLCLVIPASTLFGYTIGSLMYSNAQADICDKCKRGNNKETH